MGNCFGLCCYVCFKNTNYAMEMTDSILMKVEAQLKEYIPTPMSYDTWYISLKKDVYNNLRETISKRLIYILKKLNFPVLTSSGFVMEHFAENIAYVISSCILNHDYVDYISTLEYKCLDIPTNALFYDSKSKIIIKQETLTTIINKLINIIDQNGNIVETDLQNTDSTIHKIFDMKLGDIIMETFHKITDKKLEEILKITYMTFNNKHSNEELILKNNK